MHRFRLRYLRGCIPAVTAAVLLCITLSRAAEPARNEPDGAQPALHRAAESGDLGLIRQITAQDAGALQATDDLGLTPLHVAAAAGQTDAAALLVSLGADIRAADPSGMTPLHSAAYRGHTATAERLVDLGADVNARRANGSTPLHGAALGGFAETVAMLLARGGDLRAANAAGFTPLLTAASADKFDVMRLMLDKGADPNSTLPNGITALDLVILANDGAAVDLLLARGFDARAARGGEAPPLAMAVYAGNADIVRALVGAGADANAVMANGESMLDVAIQRGSSDVAAILVGAGADVNLREPNFGRSPLHLAALKGNVAVLDLLVANGADISAADQAGNTPINLAAKYGQKRAAEFLRANGATAAGLRENYGRNPGLAKAPRSGEARIWYLGHCGYAVKTRNHLLVFDYANPECSTDTPCLANGHIDPSEIAGEDVIVFVTHDHADHFDTTIFDWQRQIKQITYVYGFRPEDLSQAGATGYTGPAYEYVGPRQTKRIGDLDIATIAANDAGVGFVVKVDGLVLYHAGDHAGWAEGERQGYLDEIDYIAGLGLPIDVAFINVTGCHAHDPIALKEGNLYTIKRLAPKALIPTHGLNSEYVYAEAARTYADAGVKTPMGCPQAPGDTLFYSRGKLR